MEELEKNFVNDAVKAPIFNRPRKIPMIPHYDAMYDKAAQGYMQSPRVKEIIQITIHGKVRKAIFQ